MVCVNLFSARIGLARAVYSKSDIILLDDPLSAVDSVVAKHIFDNLLDSKEGILKNTIRVLVTHQTQFVDRVDTIMIMENGKIIHHDSLENLNDHGISIKSLIDDEKINESNESDSKEFAEAKENKESSDLKNNKNTDDKENQDTKEDDREEKTKDDEEHNKDKDEDKEKEKEDDLDENEMKKKAKKARKGLKEKAVRESIVKKEEIAKGGVALRTYALLLYASEKTWGKNSSIYVKVIKLIALTCLMFSSQVCLTYCEYFLGIWANKSVETQQKQIFRNTFIILVAVTLVLALLRAIIFFKMTLRGAIQLHESMCNGVLYAKTIFFENNPVGRILNRFSKDQYVVDEMLPATTYDTMQLISYCSYVLFHFCFLICAVLCFVLFCYVCFVFYVGMAVVATILASPILLVLLVPCVPIVVWSGKTFLKSSRVVKRLASKSRSPLFALFGIAYAGLPVIRAYDKSSIMLERGMAMLDTNSRMSILFQAISRWMAFTLDMMSSCLFATTAIICVVLAEYSTISPAAVGLVLTYMITLSTYLQRTVRQSADLENYMTSTERIVEYKDIEGEKHFYDDNDDGDQEYDNSHDDDDEKQLAKMQKKDQDSKWPSKGEIVISNLFCRYRDNLDFVLKDINVSIKSCEKIGIVGRTGSGKSSLFLSFFRILESSSGKIEIDGVDINSISLHKLRSNLSIIPQNAIIFSETIRYNVDPFSKYSDSEIYDALKIVSLYNTIISLPNKLSTIMSEGGNNFSVGESQLICVCRALLRKSRLLFVDEATSSVDPDTDILIQNILKTKFKDCTILTIAHRISTILHCDRIIVLNNGQIVEFDTPNNLLKKDFYNDDNAIFAKMYHESIKVKQDQ